MFPQVFCFRNPHINENCGKNTKLINMITLFTRKSRRFEKAIKFLFLASKWQKHFYNYHFVQAQCILQSLFFVLSDKLNVIYSHDLVKAEYFNNINIIHWTLLLFSDWPKTYREFSNIIIADYTTIMPRSLKVTGNHVCMLCVASRQWRSKNMTSIFFFVQCVIKQLSDSVFVIFRIIKVLVRVICLSLQLQLITLIISQKPHNLSDQNWLLQLFSLFWK